MRRGLRTPAGEDDPTVTPLSTASSTSVPAVDSCQDTGRGSRGQGRQPRAARADHNRGRAQRLERASCEPHNDRATAEDRDVDLHAFNAAWMRESDEDLSGWDTDSVA
jgi:hypothetical protein